MYVTVCLYQIFIHIYAYIHIVGKWIAIPHNYAHNVTY